MCNAVAERDGGVEGVEDGGGGGWEVGMRGSAEMDWRSSKGVPEPVGQRSRRVSSAMRTPACSANSDAPSSPWAQP